MGMILKIEVKQDKAVYRTPYSMEVIETYPLPPYSTIIGFLHNMLGLREALWGINLSVQGRYEGVLREYVSFHKYEKKKREGKIYPIIVTSLVKPFLIIHVKMPTIDWHKRLLTALQNPPYFPYLGRPEDLVTELKVNEVEETVFCSESSPEGGLALPFDAYVPVVQAKTYDLRGIHYFLPSYYCKKEGGKGTKRNSAKGLCLRVFELIPVFYVQKGRSIVQDIPVDSEGFPLWWMTS